MSRIPRIGRWLSLLAALLANAVTVRLDRARMARKLHTITGARDKAQLIAQGGCDASEPSSTRS